MKLPNNLGLKAYIILYTIFALGTFTALTAPDGSTCVYYQTLLILHPPAFVWYVLALLDASLGCLAVIPMTLRAFGKPRILGDFFQMLFVLRLLSTFLGHNYEYMVLKSAFIGTPAVGWITLGVWGLFAFPSFKEHYVYAFRTK